MEGRAVSGSTSIYSLQGLVERNRGDTHPMQSILGRRRTVPDLEVAVVEGIVAAMPIERAAILTVSPVSSALSYVLSVWIWWTRRLAALSAVTVSRLYFGFF